MQLKWLEDLVALTSCNFSLAGELRTPSRPDMLTF
jgi:hypothetical protein